LNFAPLGVIKQCCKVVNKLLISLEFVLNGIQEVGVRLPLAPPDTLTKTNR
jgi:hypothetical protein